VEVTDGALFVPPETYPYLVAQRGAISDFRENREVWLGHYATQLAIEYRTMKRFLPEHCGSILDVGGGCGGIDVLLVRHYGGEPMVTLLDGIDDLPAVSSHSATFANFKVAENFLRANHVGLVHGIDARRAPSIAPRFWDLVISQKSWSFHYEPERYLSIVKTGCIAGQTRLILDVRHDKPQWLNQLKRVFRHIACAHTGKKHSTHVFEERESHHG
jgi:hypothetical protein